MLNTLQDAVLTTIWEMKEATSLKESRLPIVSGGQTQGRLAEGRGPRGQRLNPARPVQQRVFGMDVEVRAAGAHRGIRA